MKALVKKEDELLAEWQSLNQDGQGDRTNHIKLVNQPLKEDENGKPVEDPDYGKLFAVHYDEAGEEVSEEIDIETAEFFLVKTRKLISCRDKDSYWCREVDLYDLITVFNKDDQEVATGEYRDLKDQYNLKFSHVAYVWYNERLYRWKISGAHFKQDYPDTNWFKVKGDMDRTKRPYTFKVTHLTDEKNGSIHFKSLHFKIGQPYPLEKAIPIVHELNKGLGQYYENIKKQEAQIEAPQDEPATVDDLPF